jgi:hypothetical protein
VEFEDEEAIEKMNASSANMNIALNNVTKRTKDAHYVKKIELIEDMMRKNKNM